MHPIAVPNIKVEIKLDGSIIKIQPSTLLFYLEYHKGQIKGYLKFPKRKKGKEVNLTSRLIIIRKHEICLFYYANTGSGFRPNYFRSRFTNLFIIE